MINLLINPLINFNHSSLSPAASYGGAIVLRWQLDQLLLPCWLCLRCHSWELLSSPFKGTHGSPLAPNRSQPLSSKDFGCFLLMPVVIWQNRANSRNFGATFLCSLVISMTVESDVTTRSVTRYFSETQLLLLNAYIIGLLFASQLPIFSTKTMDWIQTHDCWPSLTIMICFYQLCDLTTFHLNDLGTRTSLRWESPDPGRDGGSMIHVLRVFGPCGIHLGNKDITVGLAIFGYPLRIS